MRAAVLALAWVFAAAERQATFRIEGMSCEPCASAIEIQLGETAGVTGYIVSFEEAEARVSYDPDRTTPEKIASSIGVTGFRAYLKHAPRPLRGPEPPPATSLPALSESLDPLVADFNAARGRPRFLAILSPTCSLCLHGAKSLRDALLHDSSAPALDVFVVWAPMLRGDDEAAARSSSALLKHERVRQYWDPARGAGTAYRAKVFPDAVAKMRASLPKGHALERPFAKRDPAQPEWDIYLFFTADAEWTATPPAPARLLRQVTQLDARTSVLWRNDYARPPVEARLVDELRKAAAELVAK
jgi:copper chaperone CopZ